jgi:hypothetical protein
MYLAARRFPSKRKAFAAFTSITEVREFNGDAFNVGQN